MNASSADAATLEVSLGAECTTVRRRRWFRSRRVLWFLASGTIALTIYYQWENWRSAKELAAVRERLVQRIGTDNFADLVPQLVKDEDNFMANPVFERWTKPVKSGQTFPACEMRASELLPERDFVMPKIVEGKGGSASHFDFEGQTDAETKARALASHLAVGNALLGKLSSYGSRPDSVMKPQPSESWQKCDGNPFNMGIPNYGKIAEFQRMLGLHLRSASLVRDTVKVGQSAHVMLRLSESSRHHGIFGGLVSIAMHDIAFDTLHAAFDQDCWNEGLLNQIPQMIARHDDLSILEDSFTRGALGMHAGLSRVATSLVDMVVGPDVSFDRALLTLWARFGPRGWLDANITAVGDGHLLILGDKGLGDWRTASERSSELRNRFQTPLLLQKVPLPNPRKILAAIATPNIGNIHAAAAENLFKRRCVIHACALEKHRLQTGRFPDSLDPISDQLAAHEIKNPHRKDDPIRYRRESNGYLLWTAGEDGRDDQGDANSDWVWRRR